MRICLVILTEEAEWVSCQSIQKNLIQSYKCVFPEIDIVSVENNKTSYSKQINLIGKKSYDRVILLDYRLNISLFFNIYAQLTITQHTHFFIHVYGDFILHIKKWDIDQALLDKFSIKLICASSAQNNIVQNIFKGSENYISTIHFPVDTQIFNYSNNIIKSETLKSLNIPASLHNKNVILYTGRISYQKNIIELLDYFKKYNMLTGNSSILILAGGFDDIILPYQDFQVAQNFYQNMVLQEQDEYIFFLGSVNKKVLVHLYNIANNFISLSTYNDEDYGMSVAEALVCGLPCILTQWGGFNDFLKNDHTMPVSLVKNNTRLIPSQSSCLKQLLLQQNTYLKRTAFSNLMKEKYSIEAIAESLKDNLLSSDLCERWNGFTPSFYRFCNNSIYSSHFHSLTQTNSIKSYNNLYYNIYKNYRAGNI